MTRQFKENITDFCRRKKRDLEDMVNTDMDKLNGILNLYMGD